MLISGNYAYSYATKNEVDKIEKNAGRKFQEVDGRWWYRSDKRFFFELKALGKISKCGKRIHRFYFEQTTNTPPALIAKEAAEAAEEEEKWGRREF